MESTDNEKLELAKRLVELQNPGPLDLRQSSNPVLGEHFQEVQQMYRELFIELTAKHYSVEQMQSEIDRLSSPTGQEILKAHSDVTAEFAQLLPSRIETLNIDARQSSGDGSLQLKRYITRSRKKDEDDNRDA